jgi:hypothetical protein
VETHRRRAAQLLKKKRVKIINKSKKKMLKFICGFGAGIFIGTEYNVKPALEEGRKFLSTFFPKKD